MAAQQPWRTAPSAGPPDLSSHFLRESQLSNEINNGDIWLAQKGVAIREAKNLGEEVSNFLSDQIYMEGAYMMWSIQANNLKNALIPPLSFLEI